MPLNRMRRLVAVVATGTVLASSVAAAADDPDETTAEAGPPLHLPQALETMAEEPIRSSLRELLRAGRLVDEAGPTTVRSSTSVPSGGCAPRVEP